MLEKENNLMAKASKKDKARTIKFLGWLVESRSRNHRSSLELIKLTHKYRQFITEEKSLIRVVNNLAGVSFSLWRAVFLAEEGNGRGVLNDAEEFLLNLVHSNTVGYQQEIITNNWTFRYYLNNARDRLKSLKDSDPDLLPKFGKKLAAKATTAQEAWNPHQDALEEAQQNFEALLNKTFPSKQ